MMRSLQGVGQVGDPQPLAKPYWNHAASIQLAGPFPLDDTISQAPDQVTMIKAP